MNITEVDLAILLESTSVAVLLYACCAMMTNEYSFCIFQTRFVVCVSAPVIGCFCGASPERKSLWLYVLWEV